MEKKIIRAAKILWILIPVIVITGVIIISRWEDPKFSEWTTYSILMKNTGVNTVVVHAKIENARNKKTILSYNGHKSTDITSIEMKDDGSPESGDEVAGDGILSCKFDVNTDVYTLFFYDIESIVRTPVRSYTFNAHESIFVDEFQDESSYHRALIEKTMKEVNEVLIDENAPVDVRIEQNREFFREFVDRGFVYDDNYSFDISGTHYIRLIADIDEKWTWVQVFDITSHLYTRDQLNKYIKELPAEYTQRAA